MAHHVFFPHRKANQVAAKMQELALAEGALPHHLHTAMYTQSADHRLLTNRYNYDLCCNIQVHKLATFICLPMLPSY